MTDEELKGNRIIAVFMGDEIKLTPSHPDVEIWLKNNHTKRFSKDQFWPIVSAKYNSSWDWLMPVVEKIATIRNLHTNGMFKYMVHMELNPITGTEIEGMYKRNFFGSKDEFSCKMYEKSFIENTWLACVAFIEWYNQEKIT